MRSEPAESITLRAHAKINLILRVGAPIDAGERAGFHPICSWFHCVALHDVLVATRSSESAHTIMWDDGSPVGWDPGTDLIVRAHRAIEAHAGRALPASIVCMKSIPAGGGLGGGSSDAAATLIALNTLHDLGLDGRALAQIGASLGSDIPFFIDPGSLALGQPPRPAIVSGVGERIERVRARETEITLVAPPYGCSTGSVYRAFDGLEHAPIDGSAVHNAAMRDELDPSVWINDLEASACVVEPRLGGLLDSIRSGHPHAMVSGSGSTIVVPGPAPDIDALAPGCAIHRTRLC